MISWYIGPHYNGTWLHTNDKLESYLLSSTLLYRSSFVAPHGCTGIIVWVFFFKWCALNPVCHKLLRFSNTNHRFICRCNWKPTLSLTKTRNYQMASKHTHHIDKKNDNQTKCVWSRFHVYSTTWRWKKYIAVLATSLNTVSSLTSLNIVGCTWLIPRCLLTASQAMTHITKSHHFWICYLVCSISAADPTTLWS